MKNNKLLLIISTAALILAGGALFAVISSGGRLYDAKGSEIAVGLIAVCATLIVGFQIYNKVNEKEQIDEIKRKIEEVEKLQLKTQVLQERIQKSESTLLANQIINTADFTYSDTAHYREAAPEFALVKILDAIIPALEAGWKGVAFDRIFNSTDNYIRHIGQSGILEYCKRTYETAFSSQYSIFRFNLDIRAKTIAIQSHIDYHIVQKDFEKRMSDIEAKLAEIQKANGA